MTTAIPRNPASLPAFSQNVITSIESFPLPPRWVFVKITSSSGHVGWGEATLEGHADAVLGALKDLEKRFIGVSLKPDSSVMTDTVDSFLARTFMTFGRLLSWVAFIAVDLL